MLTSREPLKRTRLRRLGVRAERESEALARFRAVVWARVLCERCGGPGEHAHHMKRNPRVHDPRFGALLCWECHRGIHDHAVPDWGEWLL